MSLAVGETHGNPRHESTNPDGVECDSQVSPMVNDIRPLIGRGRFLPEGPYPWVSPTADIGVPSMFDSLGVKVPFTT